ncbi:1,4-dihydroxy-2-naphthoate polyprenyltransferase [Boudabousia marimammalium]|uniref:1,4-dihydroxy-2-naphthoate octaprenyltransferase n=1 Tax=Boudabousia marimammalium TaxID=156892 RepID=A0A1Q5PME5_9ACTO|nr:1,4-dihydroxy-2-naphthoate polyprenyltransferase [Boudabousia marimammalium]OKL48706.1 1,4-dihydroxy-2-naphthoate octaprenyltransferase [Boudabousia marimammalium]
MATVGDWIEGARLRTLPAAIAPVILGSAGAGALDSFYWDRALLALGVALALQVGVNYANDYSDGIRGTDDNRTGPPRLTGGKLAAPRTVLAAAFGCFALAGVLGLLLLYLSGAWWFLIPGILAVVAAWFYTGGKHPYGYYGLGEVMVMVFFGYLAVLGTTWTQAHAAPWWMWFAATGVGLLSADILMVNNLRDLASDKVSGKKTLAVRLGDKASRYWFIGIAMLAALSGVITVMGARGWWGAVSAFMLFPLCWLPTIPVRRGAKGMDLVAVLKMTGIVTVVYALVVGAWLLI